MNIDDYAFNFSSGYGDVPNNEQELKESHHKFLDSIVYGGDKTELHKIIDENSIPEKGSKDYLKGTNRRGHVGYISYFYKIFKDYQRIAPHMIFVLDWKAAVPDLKWHIEGALAGTRYKPQLPPSDRYPEDASILYGLKSSDNGPLSTVFKEYALALAQCDLYFLFVETYGDEYVVYLHDQTSDLSWGKTGMFFNMISMYRP